MECYNCGAVLQKGTYCENCGADVKIYRKIIIASNLLYNEGLEKANVRDLSGAVESLKKSLQCNKMNIDARNLLGLVYFEMGETVAALSEWVISKNLKSRDNLASQYLSQIQSNTSRLDTINQTIKKYNQALLYCRQDSKDLAIIQIKKVISLNPKMVKAYQLLALLYMEEGKNELAKKTLQNVAKIDENNTTTKRYLREVKQRLRDSNSKKQKKEDLISYQSGNDTIIRPAHFKDTSPIQTVINLVIGTALGIAIAMFLVLPNIEQKTKSDANSAIKSANDMISTKEQSINALEKKVDTLTEEADEVKKQKEEAESKLDSYEQLLYAYASYVSGDIGGAGKVFEKVKEEDLSDKAKSMYKDIQSKVNEQYLAECYQAGYEAYNKGDYQTAVDKLKIVADTDEKYKDGYATYYVAQSYRRLNDIDNALIYYRKMVELYPGTERARVAQTVINENTPATDPDNTTGTTQQTADPNTQGTDPNAQGADPNAQAADPNAALEQQVAQQSMGQ